MKIFVKRSRLLIGSCVGSVFSLSVLLPDLGFLLSLLLKFAMCLIIVGIVFRCNSIRQFLLCGIIFISVNASFAGMVLLLQNTSLNSVLMMHNASIYFNVNLPVLIIFAAVSYIVLRFIFTLLQKADKSQVYSVQIWINEQYVSCCAVVDTGNSLTEPISGSEVCVVAYSVISPLLSSDLNAFFCGELDTFECDIPEWKRRICVIPASFAVGEAVLPAARIDRMVITDFRRKRIVTNCIVAVTMHEFENTHYKMLLHPGLLDETILSQEENMNENKIT